MPEPPAVDSAWVSWVVGTLLTSLGSAGGLLMFLLRMIDGKYRAEVAELKKEISDNLTAHKAELEESRKANAIALQKTEECEKDRTLLRVEVAKLTARQEILSQSQQQLTSRVNKLES